LQTFDASSLIYAWDNYPPEQFPPLWRWMEKRIAAEEFTVPVVAFEEVKSKSPECGGWLRDAKITRLPMTAEVLDEALRIKRLLGIVNDAYNQKGVGENDLLIIATASFKSIDLVSNEARQIRLPDTPAKRKIPAVCAMSEVGIRCINFIDLIKSSGEVFGG